MAGLDWGAPRKVEPLSWGGGVATGPEIWSAAYEQLRLVDNSNAAAAALEDAYGARSRAIKEATGIDLGNPMATARRKANMFGPGVSVGFDFFGGGMRDKLRADYEGRLAQLAKERPDAIDIIRPDVSIEKDAEALAKSADDRLATLMASNPDWSSYAWSFGGGAVASLRDPLVQGTLFLGGGVGAARSVAGRVVTVAAKEALLNAGTTLAAQPMVQDWRRRAGLDNGFDEAAQNVLFAAGLGGAFGAVGRGIAEIAGTVGARAAARAQVESFAELHPGLSDQARRALGGDTSAASAMLLEIRDALPPEVRGAIDAAEELRIRDEQRTAELAHLSASRADDLEARAIVAEQIRALPDLVIEDTPRINRLVRELAPKVASITDREGYIGQSPDFGTTIADIRAMPSREAAARRPVATFLKKQGGVDPDAPIAAELRAIGLTSRNAPGLFSRDGLKALDNLPYDELPPELKTFFGADDGNGYVREQAFLEGLAAEHEGRPWRLDEASDELRSLEDYRRYLEDNGVDFDTMTDDEIRAQLAAIDDAERRFLAAEPNSFGLSTDEVAFLPPGITRRAYAAETVREIISRVGAGVDDETIKLAADTHMMAGETIEDAIDFALSQKAGVPRKLPESYWSEVPDQMVPMTDEVTAPEAEAAGVDWASYEADETLEGLSLEAMKSDIDETRWLEKVVAACKL